MKAPKSLIPGDLISILAPAKSIEAGFVEYAVEVLNKKGYRTKVSQHCLGQHNYYSGTDEERRLDFQEALDNPEVKAILCARGGYGSIEFLTFLIGMNLKIRQSGFWVLVMLLYSTTSFILLGSKVFILQCH